MYLDYDKQLFLFFLARSKNHNIIRVRTIRNR